jgi:site-specific DNA-methyltransferase (adenine-specific)
MTHHIYNKDYKLLLPTFADKQFDLAIVDIPYGIDVGNMAYLKEVKTTVKQKNGTRLNANNKKRPYTAMDWDKEVPPQSFYDELCRISKHQIIFGIDYVNWKNVGKGRIKWNKGIPDGMSFSKYEMAYCSMIDYEMELPLLWAGMNQAKSLAEPMVQQGNKQLNEQRIHPTHKPILLYKKLIQLFGSNIVNILDTHGGSMSSVIAAIDAEISITCTEINAEYYAKAKQRILNHINQQNIFTQPKVIFYQ